MAALVGTGVYPVTEDAVPAETRLAAVERALAAGARVVQLRDKSTPRRELLAEARAMKRLCDRLGAAFIVNDDVAIALACDADGVHVGQEDFPAEEARALLGESKVVGLSVHSAAQAREVESISIDYLGVGAMFATSTKSDATLAGTALLRAVRAVTERPLVGIGGIDSSNAASVFEAGADAVAIVRGIFGQAEIGGAVRRLLEIAATSRQERGRRQ
ncbi:MAG TPA: thiamine phosphate synthase [Chloroflexota bacterium]